MSTHAAAAVAAAPRTLVCFKVDTLGDLVLFGPTLRAIRAGWPETRIVVAIRGAYADIAAVIAPGVEWLPTPLDPFIRGPDADAAELRRLREAVISLRPDVVAAATSRRTWLDIVLSADSGAERRVALGPATGDEFFATQLRVHLGIDAAAAFTEHVSHREDEPDWRRNFVLADALLQRVEPRVEPRIEPPANVRQTAGPILARLGLEPGRYVVCAAAGFANVALKTWAPERFGVVLRHLRQRHGLPGLLIGHATEREHLERAAAAAGTAAVWVGQEGELTQLLSLLAESALFLGNDTGAMHLAAALQRPVVAVFGGGTWPRFVAAGDRSTSVVQPLPCFGCGWDCAFGDAPCIGEITPADVIAAVDATLGATSAVGGVRPVEHLPRETQEMMGKAAERYRAARRDHLARQHKLEEITDLDLEKDAAIAEKEAAITEKEAAVLKAEAAMKVKEASIFEKEREIHLKEAEIHSKEAEIHSKEAEIHSKEREIADLKKTCNEREQLIIELDRNARATKAIADTIAADKALLEKTVRELPPDRAHAVETIAGQGVHIRNLEALLQIRAGELAELRKSHENWLAGRQNLEQAKYYHRLLAEKEAVIRELHRNCEARESVIRQLSAQANPLTGWIWKLGVAVRAYFGEKVARPSGQWFARRFVDTHWMQIGVLRQYGARTIRWDAGLSRGAPTADRWPRIGIVTPSYGQERFIERTMRSILDQQYPKLVYVVQDGASKDHSAEIIARHQEKLHHWESVPDHGQADAIGRGFAHMKDALGPDDVMAWLNSDDLLAPGSLGFVAAYFASHPEVDLIYGHRIIIDDEDREVGRWVMPRHDPAGLEWVDYVPQETMFWRKRAWDRVGGIDPSFQFALDWDLLARMQQAGCRIVRVPYFLGAFRVHADQKTTQVIHTTGADEMRRIRTRFHGENQDHAATIERHVCQIRKRGVLAARLMALGIRW